MKKSLLSSFSVIIISSALLYFPSCNGSTVKEDKAKEPEAKSAPTPEDTMKLKAYVCPMGPQCGQGDSAGKCPSCGMDMKANPKFKKN
jgi:hypothetical protein